MNPRAYLFDREDFYYPTDNTMSSLAEFYSILEGYRRKGIDFEITWSVGIEDDKGTSIYSADIVEVTDTEQGIAQERGVVEYSTGSFLVVNQDGLVFDFEDLAHNLDTDKFSIRVVSHAYKQKTTI